MRLGIVAARGNDRAARLAARLCDEFDGEGADVRVAEPAATDLGRPGVPVDEMISYPLVVSIGGDGTFLYAARHVGSTPILGVNLGEVGFLNAVPPDEASDRIREEVARIHETGSPRFREVPRIEASGEEWRLAPALNEITVQGPQRGRGRGIDVEVRVDGSPFADGHADGTIVATPTGSTAYNLSEGGPLVHPGVGAMIVTGMAATGEFRPLVVPEGATVTVRATGAEAAVVASDGRDRRRVGTPATATVRAADRPARIAGPRSDFFRALDKID